MNEYIVKVSVPVKSNNWQAKIKTLSHIKADNVNGLIEQALCDNELPQGTRIFEIWERTPDIDYYKKIYSPIEI